MPTTTPPTATLPWPHSWRRRAKPSRLGLGLNAGHDLSLENLAFFHASLPHLDEVSIGHALISDALYLGIAETIRRYLACLNP